MLDIKGFGLTDKDFAADELKAQASQVFADAARVAAVKKQIAGIKADIEGLRELVFARQEIIDNEKAVAVFKQKMQIMMNSTFDNLERYQIYGWKELFQDGGDCDEMPKDAE